jgi:hypothetical protein
MERLLQAYLTPARLRFRWNNRNRLAASESLKSSLRRLHEDSARAGIVTYTTIFNAGLFIALLDQDMIGFHEAILFSRSAWHRQFHARGLSVLMFETSEDLPQLLGGEYRRALHDLELGNDWFDAINKAGKKFSKFTREHREFLGEIRHAVGAHRDHNAVSQMDIMEKIDPLKVMKLAVEFSGSIADLVDFNIAILRYMNLSQVKIHTIAKALSRSGERKSE